MFSPTPSVGVTNSHTHTHTNKQTLKLGLVNVLLKKNPK